MSANTRKIIVFVLAIAAAGLLPAMFPNNLSAREATPVVVVDNDARVGGEPGEDPHLKTDPGLRPVKDTDALGASGGGIVGVGDECIVQAEGSGEGRGHSLGSRVTVWRMILWAWLCQMQR